MTMDEQSDRERPVQSDADRQARDYRAPVLRVLGPVAVLTNSVDMVGAKDGGANNSKT